MPEEDTGQHGIARTAGRRRARRWAIATLVVAALIVSSQIGFVPASEWTLLDAGGRPLEGAYLAYYFHGHRMSLVDTIAYERSGGIVRSGTGGRVRLPARLYRKGALDGYAQRWVRLLYAPGAHLGRDLGPGLARLQVTPEIRHAGRTFWLRDVSSDPAAWNASLEALYELVRFELVRRRGGAAPRRIESAPEVTAALAAALGSEYRELLRRHAETPLAAGRGEEGTWGRHLERWWPPRLKELDARLRR